MLEVWITVARILFLIADSAATLGAKLSASICGWGNLKLLATSLARLKGICRSGQWVDTKIFLPRIWGSPSFVAFCLALYDSCHCAWVKVIFITKVKQVLAQNRFAAWVNYFKGSRVFALIAWAKESLLRCKPNICLPFGRHLVLLATVRLANFFFCLASVLVAQLRLYVFAGVVKRHARCPEKIKPLLFRGCRIFRVSVLKRNKSKSIFAMLKPSALQMRVSMPSTAEGRTMLRKSNDNLSSCAPNVSSIGYQVEDHVRAGQCSRCFIRIIHSNSVFCANYSPKHGIRKVYHR